MADYIYCGTYPPVGADGTQEMLAGSFKAIWFPRRKMAVQPKPGERVWLVWRDNDDAIPLLLGGGRLIAPDPNSICWTNASLPGVRPAAMEIGYGGPTNMAFLHLTSVIIPEKRLPVKLRKIRTGLNLALSLNVDLLEQILPIPVTFIDAIDGDYVKGDIIIGSTDAGEERILECFSPILKKRGVDWKNIACGVNPSPDFGYYELADRFWRASLGTYLMGVTRGFWERGAGFAEPWLFNVYHSIELYIKGFRLYADYFRNIHNDPLFIGDIESIDEIIVKEISRHDLNKLYSAYVKEIESVTSMWNRDVFGEPPKIERMILSDDKKSILKEIVEVDESSFRFRYPGLRKIGKPKIQELQRLDWHYDKEKLLPITGLPLDAGFFFDHIKVINCMQIFIGELKRIAQYHDACWSYISDNQSNFRV